MPIPVCGMKPIECTTPSSLLPSPISAVTRSAKVSKCFSSCTLSSISGAFSGSRSAIRWISRSRSNPVSTSCAPCSWATRAMWNAIDESVMRPLQRILLPSSSPAMFVLNVAVEILVVVESVAHAHAAVDRDDRTGDVTRILGRQEADHPGDLGGGADPLRRDEFQCPLLNPLIQRAGHIGVDVARGYHIRSHVGL